MDADWHQVDYPINLRIDLLAVDYLLGVGLVETWYSEFHLLKGDDHLTVDGMHLLKLMKQLIKVHKLYTLTYMHTHNVHNIQYIEINKNLNLKRE